MRVLMKAVISFFIFCHVMVMVMSSLPDRSAVAKKIYEPLRIYQQVFGLSQAWRMFAPNPSRTNSYIIANLKFSDGSNEQWTFPRPSQMSSGQRFLSGERFRKFQQEYLRTLELPLLWNDLGKFVTREVQWIEDSGQKRQLEQISFVRHYNYIKAPEVFIIPHGQKSTQYKTKELFQFNVNEKVRYETRYNTEVAR